MCFSVALSAAFALAPGVLLSNVVHCVAVMRAVMPRRRLAYQSAGAIQGCCCEGGPAEDADGESSGEDALGGGSGREVSLGIPGEGEWADS